MKKSTAKRFGGGRITALALIALLTLALGYLHFSGGSQPVSVLLGAPCWSVDAQECCSYATENGSSAADCGTPAVPENRHDPNSRLIALPVTVIHARSAHPGVPISRLQGRPRHQQHGVPGRELLHRCYRRAVLVGYRGVDGSSRLDCPEVELGDGAPGVTSSASRPTAPSPRRTWSCADRPPRSDGVDLAGYSIPEEVDDMEVARRALGYHQIDLVSESAGTRVAMIYAWRYPASIHRSVMIGVNPPGNFLWDATTTNEQIGRYAALCAQATSCRSRTPDLAASMKSAVAHVPSHWLFLPIKKGDFKTAAFFGLMNDTSAGGGPIAAPLTINTLLSADKGDASGAWFLSVMAQIAFPHAFAWGDQAAIGRSDATDAKHFYASGANSGSLHQCCRRQQPDLGRRLRPQRLAGEPGRDRVHPRAELERSDVADRRQPRRRNAARECDLASSCPTSPNSRQVVPTDSGFNDDFFGPYEPAAGTRLINTYLDSGKVDTSLYTHNKVDFSPSQSQSGDLPGSSPASCSASQH